MANPVVHFEINGPDGAVLTQFYSDLFAWRTERVPDVPYWVVDTQAGSGINGGIAGTTDGVAFVTFYVASDEPEALMRKAEQAGGRTTTPMTQTEWVTYGQFADPDGLIVGIIEAAESNGQRAQVPSPGGNPPVDWFEVLGSDGSKTQAFYRDVFGWELEGGSPAYGFVRHHHDEAGNDVSIGGGLGGGTGDIWATVYARVPDCEATLTKAHSIGGVREYGPNEVGGNTRTGAFRDPAGNVFGVYEAG